MIPCRDEAAAIPGVLAGLPEGWRAIVVDNGSSDGTADVAARLGAVVVHEPRPGYGAAVHAGVEAATAEHVAVVDGDGTFDLADLVPLLDEVRTGRVDMAVGRRRPVGQGVWPWHSRLGTLLLATIIRRRSGFGIHDLAPMRVSRRDALLRLGVEDRRFGYPLELMLRAADAGWSVHEVDVTYGRRAKGTRSKVSGSVRGTTRVMKDFARVWREVPRALSERRVLDAAPPAPVPHAPVLLVVAKAPVPGLAKTRVAASVGDEAAADLAAAALLDTLDTVGRAGRRLGADVVVAMTGDLDAAARAVDIRSALEGLRVVPQRGDDFAQRLVAAHHDADAGHGVVQIGMDTPQLDVADLEAAVDHVRHGRRVLGPADDGGWWLLGLPRVDDVDAVAAVPMSTDRTAELTEVAVGPCAHLRPVLDMDTWDDAVAIATTAPHTRLAHAVAQLTEGAAR